MPPAAQASAVIVAAGSSTRMAQGGVAGRKPWLDLAGTSILEHACAAFDAARSVAEIVLVVHAADVERVEELAAERKACAKVRAVVAGGAERADSVRLGALRASPDVAVICVHDAARPLVEPSLVDLVVERALSDGAALCALPVRDTLKLESEQGGRAERTLDRSRLWAAQTPQAFRAADFRDVLARAAQDGFRPTDDAALWERYRGAVSLVLGSPSNLKITTPDDLLLAEAWIAVRGRASTRGSAAESRR